MIDLIISLQIFYFSANPIVVLGSYSEVVSFVRWRWSNISCIFHHKICWFSLTWSTSIGQCILHLALFLLLQIRYICILKVAHSYVISACVERFGVCWVTGSVSLDNLALWIHLYLSGMSQAFQLKLELLYLVLRSKHFLQACSLRNLLWLIAYGIVQVSAGCTAHAYIVILRNTTVWQVATHWVFTLRPILGLLGLWKFALWWHLRQNLMAMLLTPQMVLVDLMTEVITEFHYLLLSAISPWVLKHGCHIDHGLWFLLKQTWVRRSGIHNFSTFASMETMLASRSWWEFLEDFSALVEIMKWLLCLLDLASVWIALEGQILSRWVHVACFKAY